MDIDTVQCLASKITIFIVYVVFADVISAREQPQVGSVRQILFGF